jgi:Protein of unknown function (DUF3349)
MTSPLLRCQVTLMLNVWRLIEVGRMYLADRVARFVAFVRVGYPTGMPATGYVPLAALSRRRLCDDEIDSIARELMMRRRWRISTADVGVEITRITNEMPSPDDIERIQRRLTAIGYVRG